MYRNRSRQGRRRALKTLAALACVGLPGMRTTPVAFAADAAGKQREARRMTDMIGTNGWPGSDADISMWRAMGISWGRGSVGPGQPDSAKQAMRVNGTGNAYDSDLPSAILRNNANGIRSLLFLGYTPKWNASVPGDSKSAPVNVDAWQRYVEAVVSKYSKAPYNVRHFQIWNEAAGRLSGGLPQATFWHGPKFDRDEKRSGPYERAMQDYVDKIHLPAARIVRKYGAYIVYGGWPDQGGVDTYVKWLEYKSARSNERMIDWVDYLDTHYLSVGDLDGLYQRYVKQGPARGLWQTEIGDRYMEDPHYLPRYFFQFAVWALDRNWDDPDKYVTMIYHWDGFEPYRLTHRGPPRTYNPSGRSLVVLNKTVPGLLAPFSKPLRFGPEAKGSALLSDSDIVIQVSAAPGWRTVEAAGVEQSSLDGAEVLFIDAVTGAVAPHEDATLTSDNGTLSIRFRVPAAVNGADRKPPVHLAYLVVRRQKTT
ncbi:hypothetical protein [Paraburkholderia diazotrophica]|uniref:Uncharacterized protein n=1 Tax=Paraburkholderia diazotrophica TaxID=667676 RepID=A0A1H7BW81_9BURK|nr:hypothetical protein [Paraburkholderia diazotrophica]SEJ81711.1 hypothetical protein SAMN05192539_101963 [Paraburkholderia diazotrophica]